MIHHRVSAQPGDALFLCRFISGSVRPGMRSTVTLWTFHLPRGWVIAGRWEWDWETGGGLNHRYKFFHPSRLSATSYCDRLCHLALLPARTVNCVPKRDRHSLQECLQSFGQIFSPRCHRTGRAMTNWWRCWNIRAGITSIIRSGKIGNRTVGWRPSTVLAHHTHTFLHFFCEGITRWSEVVRVFLSAASARPLSRNKIGALHKNSATK